jgi:formylglycine-generating enzyme required for sulfatase activity
MRYGSSLWLTCLVTTSLVAGSGESSGQAPPPAIAPFDAAQAKVYQKAWADHLGVPVESKNSIGMKFVLIPPGEFKMGSPESEPGRQDIETQHPVTLTAPFSLGVYEVTQSQYEHVMGINPSRFKGPDNPVEAVSRNAAVAFCRKLTDLPEEKSAGREYRLPTEAEWEYACRAGTTTAFSFGDDATKLGKYAWFEGNSGETTHAVGEKLPNPWSVYDMHGNAWEMCEDKYAPYQSGAATNPRGPDEGSYHVRRGGGWNCYSAEYCRSALRVTVDPTFRTISSGFRLVLSSPSVQSPEAVKDK